MAVAVKNMSVAVGPGATQFAVIPVLLSSFANVFVIVSIAAFDAVYVAIFGFNKPTNELDSNIILPTSLFYLVCGLFAT